MARRSRAGRHTPLILRPQFAGMVLAISAVFTVLSLLSFSRGLITGGWLRLLRQAFGWGIYLTPVGLGIAGVWLLLQGMGRPPAVSRLRAASGIALVCLLLALTHLTIPPAQRLLVARGGGGGGYLGWLVSGLLLNATGESASYVLLLAATAVSLCLLLDLSPREVAETIASMVDRLRRGSTSGEEMLPDVASWQGSQSEVPPKRGRRPVRSPAPPAQTSPGALFPHPRVIGAGQQWALPPLGDILTDYPEPEIKQAEIRHQVRVIEETMIHFGVPARVVEVNQGPVVTQFGVEPGFITRRSGDRQKVKVSQISALADDLALALAASPIRIEAPIPGRPLVGVEVPNAEPGLVSLRGVLESDAFELLDSPLRIGLGREVSGQPIVADLAAMPHLLIAGATGSGKSACINAIVSCLLCNNTPDELKCIMVDPKMVELTPYNGIPHLLAPVVVEMERVVGTLKWVARHMDERYERFAEVGARNLEDYNQRQSNRGQKGLPYIVVLIDELADIMMVAPDDVERLVCRVAQMARATGIHLVIATQRPSVDVVTGLIKANFPARIAFATVSQTDSRVILDTVGAERLLGRGDMLYMAPDSAQLVRIQGCFVSERDLRALVHYWKGSHVSPPAEEVVQRPLWPDMDASGSGDDLLEEAISLVRQHQRASLGFLQRRLRVGRPRAARLMELMEERGIIDSARGALSQEEPSGDIS